MSQIKLSCADVGEATASHPRALLCRLERMPGAPVPNPPLLRKGGGKN